MDIQLCNIDDCHGNDYDVFGKRRDRIGGWHDRIGGWRERIGCCGDGHGGLVTVETGARVGRHESTFRTIRGHVTYDTRRQWWPAQGQWWSAHGQWWSAGRRRGVVGERRKLARRRRGLMGEQRGLAAAERTNGDGGWGCGAAMGKKRQSHGPSRTRRVLLGPWLCHEGAGIRTCALRARCSLPDGLSLHRCCRGRRRRARCRGCPGGR